jgi:hypothetical protein
MRSLSNPCVHVDDGSLGIPQARRDDVEEMVRVCAVGSRVVVCDMYASVDPVKAVA